MDWTNTKRWYNMKKKRGMLEVVTRITLFLIFTAACAASLAALFLFVWSELLITPFTMLNYIIKAAISLIFSVSVFVTWCWFGYLVLSPFNNKKE